MPGIDKPFYSHKKIGPDDETTLVMTYRELSKLLNMLPDNEFSKPLRKKIRDRLINGGFRV